MLKFTGKARADMYLDQTHSTIGFWTDVRQAKPNTHALSASEKTARLLLLLRRRRRRRRRLLLCSCCFPTPPGLCRAVGIAQNGGYYHYATGVPNADGSKCKAGDCTSYESVLPKVKAYHDSIGVPFGHWQFDS